MCETAESEGRSSCAASLLVSAILQAMVRCDRLDLLFDIHNAMVDDGIDIDAHLWVTLSHAYTKAAYFEEARAILESLEDLSPLPIKELTAGHNVILNEYAKSGRFEEAMALFEEKFRVSGRPGGFLHPDEISMSSLLSAAARSRSQPLEVIERLRELARPQFSNAVLTALLNCYRTTFPLSDEERIARVEEVFDLILELKLEPSTTTYNCVMSAHVEFGTPTRALEHFSKMEDSGLLPDEVTFKIVGAACKMTGLYGKAQELERLQESMRIIHGRPPRKKRHPGGGGDATV